MAMLADVRFQDFLEICCQSGSSHAEGLITALFLPLLILREMYIKNRQVCWANGIDFSMSWIQFWRCSEITVFSGHLHQYFSLTFTVNFTGNKIIQEEQRNFKMLHQQNGIWRQLEAIFSKVLGTPEFQSVQIFDPKHGNSKILLAVYWGYFVLVRRKCQQKAI